LTELIGEEIYDEFDPHHQGAQLSSFIPPDLDAGIITVNNQESLGPIAGHDTHTSFGSGLGLGLGPMIVKPIALKAMEGFGALTSRSRSAPPIPREQLGKRPSSKFGVVSQAGDNTDNGATTVSSNGLNEKINIPYLDPPTPHLMNSRSISGTDPQPPSSQPPTPMLDSAIPQTSSSSPHLTAASPSRITSPTSLEAYFLERKRRGASGSGGTTRAVTPVPGGKGKGFKSSPLGPAERDITDGVRKKSTNIATGEGDRGAPPSETETVVEGDKMS
jgi:hypothetical protein